MMKKWVFKERYGEVYYEENKDYYVVLPIGFLSVSQWKQLMAKMFELSDSQTFSKGIIDHRQMRLLSPEAIDYLIRDVVPRLHQRGIRKLASVMSRDAFMEITATRIYEEAGNTHPLFRSSKFDSLEKAEQWIIRKNPDHDTAAMAQPRK